MISGSVRGPTKLVIVYYGATVAFALLDYLLGFNIRLMFLEPWPGWRALYYALCLGLFVLMLWRPAWAGCLATGETLLTLSLLILTMAMRVMLVTDEMIDIGSGYVSIREVANLLISGTILYLALLRGMAGDRRKFR
jgi:hypothetical protein